MAEICITQICVDPDDTIQICIDPPVTDCVIGCSAEVVVAALPDNCLFGCSADVTVDIDDSVCKCQPVKTLLPGSDPDCYAIGDYIRYTVTGCGCDDPCCGPAGWRWVSKPKWATDDTVCLENGVLTIGPMKGYGQIKIELECSECPEDDCPDGGEITLTDEVRQYITNCTVDTLLSSLAVKNGTTAPITADPGTLTDAEASAIGEQAGAELQSIMDRVRQIK